MADKTATYGINVPVDTNADKAADSVEALRSRIDASQNNIKAWGSSLRLLKGKTDEVKEAKKQLRAAVIAEQESISRNVLGLGKLGATVVPVKGKTDELTSASGALAKGMALAKSIIGDFEGKIGGLKESFSGVGKAAKLMATGVGLVAAAIVAVGIAAGAAVVGLAKFTLESADLLRTQGLLREAATGSADNAAAFGTQIEAIADKVPLAREQLNQLSVDVSKAFRGTYVSGQGAVDTFNAVAQASAAMGDDAGRAIQSVVEKGKLFGRLGIGLNELQGTGIQLQDVATELSKGLGISLKEAQTQLLTGRVQVDKGAAAIRAAVEKQFGGVNEKKLLSFDNIARRLKERLQGLTSGVNLEKILAPLLELTKLFDQNTTTGKLLKDIFTAFGDTLGNIFTVAAPLAKKAFYIILIAGLEAYNVLLDGLLEVKKQLGPELWQGLKDGTIAFEAFKIAVAVAGAVFQLAVGQMVVFATLWRVLNDAIDTTEAAFRKFFNATKSINWTELGVSIIQGIVAGLTGNAGMLTDAVASVATNVKKTFAGLLGIHSPSTVFQDMGANTMLGYQKGVAAEAPAAAGEVAKGTGLGAPAGASIGGGGGGAAMPGGGGGSGGGGDTFNVSVAVDVKAGGGGQEVADKMKSDNFRSQLTRAIEELLKGAGVQTQTPQAEVT